MNIAKLDKPWKEVPVSFQEFTLNSEADAEILRQHCKFIYIELEEDYWDTIKHIYPPTDAEPIHPEAKKLQEEYPRAKETYEEAKDFIAQMMESVKSNNVIDIKQSKTIVDKCIKSIFANPNAMFWLSRIKKQDAYTAEHCLRVCVLAIAFGHFLDLPKSQIATLGLCGMLHDVGKMKIPNEIINKPGPLNETEYKLMKEHTRLGYLYLKEQGGVDELVCRAAVEHHERVDGNGYPHNLPEDKIHFLSKIISIIDCYDAVTSTRSYRAAFTPHQALNIIYKERAIHFDQELVKQFIRMIGVYPPGSLVEMTNGETAIVLSANPDHKLQPKVELIIDEYGILRKPQVIDLTHDNYDENNQIYKIKKPLTDEEISLDLGIIIKEMH